VSFDKKCKKWQACICIGEHRSSAGKHKTLGYFTDETEAARTYDAAARKYFGEFANLNLPHLPPIVISPKKKPTLNDVLSPRIAYHQESGCWLWQGATSSGYGQIRYDFQTCYVHRLMYEKRIGPIPEGLLVKQTCGVRLCCNPDHLRLCTAQQKARSKQKRKSGSSHYKGVGWSASGKKWQANIKTGDTVSYLGQFSDEKEAAMAYDKAAREHFGEFAACNFPKEE
jgi:hypothetical protein